MGCSASLSALVAVAASLSCSACGGSSLSSPSSVASRPAFAVMTYNVQHGLNANGKYNLQGAIDVIARVQPDIVGVQELTKNHPSYNCDDQPELIRHGLEAATARQWAVFYEREWFTPDRSCLDRGAGNDVETEGLAFFAPQSLVGTQELPLFNTRLGIVSRTASVVPVPVVVTQLASGTTAASDRITQLSQLLPWAAAQGAPRILIGDMNSQPAGAELQPVLAEYRDAWTDALAAGTARGVISGDTRVRGGRIDYVFYAGGVQVDSAEIVDTTLLLGVSAEVSDHRPVVVRFRMR